MRGSSIFYISRRERPVSSLSSPLILLSLRCLVSCPFPSLCHLLNQEQRMDEFLELVLCATTTTTKTMAGRPATKQKGMAGKQTYHYHSLPLASRAMQVPAPSPSSSFSPKSSIARSSRKGNKQGKKKELISP
ncbi:hypothetical protein CLAIMM_11877 [Cladophialophora immunda]|nr:hypothetical protein CLAIMM_11877 [Cladophialophora immunda]